MEIEKDHGGVQKQFGGIRGIIPWKVGD